MSTRHQAPTVAGPDPADAVAAQDNAYLALVPSIPDLQVEPCRRGPVSDTPYLDGWLGQLATDHADHGDRAACAGRVGGAGSVGGARDVVTALFAVAVLMVGHDQAQLGMDELIRQAGQVRAGWLTPAGVRALAIDRAARARCRHGRDLIRGRDDGVLERHPPVTALAPITAELEQRVSDYLMVVSPFPLTDPMQTAVVTGVGVVADLIDRYDQRVCTPGAVLVSMQARQSGRAGRNLPAALRTHGMPERVAATLARLMVGCRRDPTTGLLWHAVRRTPIGHVEAMTLARWRRDLSDLDPSQFRDDTHRAQVRRRLTRTAQRNATQHTTPGSQLNRRADTDAGSQAREALFA